MADDAGFSLVLEPVAFAADLHDVSVVQQSVEHRRRQRGIAAEDGLPITEGEVAGEDGSIRSIPLKRYRSKVESAESKRGSGSQVPNKGNPACRISRKSRLCNVEYNDRRQHDGRRRMSVFISDPKIELHNVDKESSQECSNLDTI